MPTAETSTPPEPVLPAQPEVQWSGVLGLGVTVAVVAALVVRWRRSGSGGR